MNPYARRTIDTPWVDLPPRDVGQASPGLRTPDCYIPIGTDEAPRLRFVSAALVMDGVVVQRIESGIIHGQGEWDPLGGWQPFAISAKDGRKL